MSKSGVSFLTFLLVLFSGGSFSQEKDLLELEFISAKQIKGNTNTHADRGIISRVKGSGIVDVVFMVGTDGLPKHIDVMRSTDSRFEKSAVKLVKKFEYTSASIDGKAVESRDTARIKLDHLAVDNRGFYHSNADLLVFGDLDRYVLLFNRALRRMSSDQPDKRKIRRTLDSISRRDYKTLFEVFHDHFLQYTYEDKFGTKYAKFEQLMKMSMYEDVRLSDKISPTLSQSSDDINAQVLGSLISFGRFQESLDKYREMQSKTPALVQRFAGAMSKISKMKMSDRVVETTLILSERGSSFMKLFKNSFSVGSELDQNQVASYELRCDRKYLKLEHKPDVTVSVPEAWGQCDIQISGVAGSSVYILQK